MKFEKPSRVALAMATILALGACASNEENPMVCIYSTEVEARPNPSFWATTEHDGQRLIKTDSALAKLIGEKLAMTPLNNVAQDTIQTGDIVVVTEQPFTVPPALFGIDRRVISNCRPD
jgi:hypothetical protein